MDIHVPPKTWDVATSSLAPRAPSRTQPFVPTKVLAGKQEYGAEGTAPSGKVKEVSKCQDS